MQIQKLHQLGYGIVLFTNQGGIGASSGEKQRAKTKLVIQKVTGICKSLKVPVIAFVSTYYSFNRSNIALDCSRKPGIGMWNWLELINNKSIYKAKSFFVGDADGNTNSISNSDKKFAENVGNGFKFYTASKFFNSDINNILNTQLTEGNISKKSYGEEVSESKTQEMIIFTGYPAAGKTTYFKTFLSNRNYKLISRDLLGSHEKCIKNAIDLIKSEENIVIDNTNPSLQARQRYIDLAKQYKMKCRSVWFKTDFNLAWKMNELRSEMNEKKLIPKVAYHMYNKNFSIPKLSEGFSECIVVDPSIQMNRKLMP